MERCVLWLSANYATLKYIDKPKTLLPADKLIQCFADSTTDCVKVLDSDARLLSVSDNGYKMLEVDNPKQIIGKNWLSFWEGEFGKTVRAAFETARRGKLAYFEGFCPTFKQTPKWWQVTIVPLFDDHQSVVWILALSRDVTELHQLRTEIAALRASAK